MNETNQNPETNVEEFNVEKSMEDVEAVLEARESDKKPKREPRNPKLWEALIPVLFMTAAMLVATLVLGMDPHIPIVLSCVVAAAVAAWCGHSWGAMISGILDSIARATEALLIVMIVGMLIGAWVLAGSMPTMVYYGLSLLNPYIFLPIGAILCGIVGLATGSSWTASGTVGVALMGVAMGLGIPAPLAAGMVISGAYMGDKWSPLSDSTNVAAATAETPLYSHVRSMVTTTLPSFILALVVYGVVGIFMNHTGYDDSTVHAIQSTITENFYISPWLLLPAVAVFVAAAFKIPAIPSLLGVTAIAGIIAIIAQGASVGDVLNTMHYGVEMETGNEIVDKLVNRGGLDSMMWTISLIMFALAFGGILEKCGFIEALLGKVVRGIKSVGGLVSLTIVTGIVCDFVLTDQYLALIVPGRMYMKAYDDRGLDRSFLSRTLEDGGTMWSPLIPWNGCGAYQSATLGVNSFTFLPFAFMNLINPIVAIIFAFTGIGIKYKDGRKPDKKAKKAA